MKVGIWLESDYSPKIGGGFSYYDKLVKAIDNYAFHPSLDICFVKEGEIAEGAFHREVISLDWQYTKTLRDRILLRIPYIRKHYRQELKAKMSTMKNDAYSDTLRANGVQVLYYLNQAEAKIQNYPFVANNWDIGHCSTFAFPELALNGEYGSRHDFYTHILPQALFVFVESEAGKQELLKFTRISGDKIKVVPIFAGNSVSLQVSQENQNAILDTYELTANRYFFYPAQFWAHKNHFNLIKAFAQFLSSHPDYKLVLTGSDQGNLAYIKETIRQLGLEQKVVFPGFVPMEHINTFYRNATSLVMASYFGPTNMPPIEAMELGCPVICSDLAGHREILGDAAIYFELGDYAHITKAMEQMVVDRDMYIKRINEQCGKSKFKIENALSSIDKYLQELIPIRSTWA